MHRLFTFLILMTALYGGPGWIAKPAAASETPAPAAASDEPHIALLLPLGSHSFGTAAEAVKHGVMAAASIQAPPLPLRVYSTSHQTDKILAAYQQALQAGAQVVIGPLTRDAVTALAKSSLVQVPTLALNLPDNDNSLPRNLYLFGLSAEAEARQIARVAFDEGLKTATIISSGTPLAKRTQAAFLDQWQELGGKTVLQANVPPDQERLAALHEDILKHPADMIFLATDAQSARLARPYLDVTVPTYATSRIHDGDDPTHNNVDLNGIHFVEMPWLLIPDHPAVMIYPRPEPGHGVELDRLYGLGIDAFRLALILVKNPLLQNGVLLDGVTGQISLSDQRFSRDLTEAQFRQGQATPEEAPAMAESQP